MLIDLLRSHLRPYRHWLAGAVALQLAGTLAALYLPSLNADIIDHGIARGDTGFIVSTGGWMLLVTLIQGASIVGGCCETGPAHIAEIARRLREAGLLD